MVGADAPLYVIQLLGGQRGSEAKNSRALLLRSLAVERALRVHQQETHTDLAFSDNLITVLVHTFALLDRHRFDERATPDPDAFRTLCRAASPVKALALRALLLLDAEVFIEILFVSHPRWYRERLTRLALRRGITCFVILEWELTAQGLILEIPQK